MHAFAASAMTFVLLALWSALAQADPGNYVITVYEKEGEMDLSLHYWTVEPSASSKVVWPEIGLGYGVSKRWYTKVFASGIGPGIGDNRLDSLNWQNDYLLTQGQYPFDLALHTNLVLNRNLSDGKVLEFGPILQTDVGRVQVNTNLIFARGFQAARPTPTQLRYQWQLKYRYQPLFQFGLQGFGELGAWNQWSSSERQSHRFGPLIAGTYALGRRHEWRYQLSWLTGKTYGSAGNMLTARLTYVF